MDATARAELIAGAAVLAVAAGFLLWSAGAGMMPRGSYPVVASFPSIDGVEVGTDVRLAGVPIGRITDIRLNPQTYYAEATISVPNDIALPVDSAALIQSDGLLGGGYVEIQPGGAMEMLPPGGEIEDVQGAVSLLSLMMKFVDSGSGGAAAPAAEGTAP
jgi:phospholipid/cholesterol/gamma-HCH transport system substrate-binding protein